MPANRYVIRLPWLREAASESNTYMEGLCRFWPGLPDMPQGSWYCPEDMPLAPQMANAFLAELAALDADSLAFARHGAVAEKNARDAREFAELADIAAFEKGQAREAHEERLARLQAHKNLLFIWLAQGRMIEIADLARNFDHSAQMFSRIMAEGEEIPPTPLDGRINLDQSILPSWQAVLMNMAWFLPDNCAIFAEAGMIDDLREFPASKTQNDMRVIKAPLWQIIGLDGRKHSAIFDQLITVYSAI